MKKILILVFTVILLCVCVVVLLFYSTTAQKLILCGKPNFANTHAESETVIWNAGDGTTPKGDNSMESFLNNKYLYAKVSEQGELISFMGDFYFRKPNEELGTKIKFDPKDYTVLSKMTYISTDNILRIYYTTRLILHETFVVEFNMKTSDTQTYLITCDGI